MIHPLRNLTAASGMDPFAGSTGAAEAILTGCGAATSALIVGSSETGAGSETATIGGCSLFMVATVVIAIRPVSAGAGASCLVSDGSGERAAVRIVPGCTVTVFTAFGLIGSVDTGRGISELDRAMAATRTGAEPVRSSSF